MSKTSTKPPQILPATIRDVPTLAAISGAAFETDSQTEMKSHGKAPFLMGEYALRSLPDELKNPRIRIVKAVDGDTGEIIGFCIWGFRGVEAPIFPAGGEGEGVEVDKKEGAKDDKGEGEVKPGSGSGEVDGGEEKKEKEGKKGRETSKPDDPIARLERLTDGDLKEWMDAIMPRDKPEVKCIFVVGLSVSPAFQRRGVGSALLKWGTDLIDGRDGAFAWVHSSAGAWPAYERARFRTVRTLDLDLDAYAPVPAPVERYPGGKWGRYMFRYMVYGTPPHVPSYFHLTGENSLGDQD